MDSFLDKLTGRLLDSFSEVGGINHIDCVNLPSKRRVAQIAQHLLHLMFPGFYDKDPLRNQKIEEAIKKQLLELHDMLAEEIVKSIEFQPPKNANLNNPTETANKIACRYLENLPHIRELLSKDVEAAYDGDPAATSMEEIILAYPGLEATAVHRLAHELYEEGVALLPRMMSEWVHSRTGIDIHPGATIGTHFFIDHGTGVVIGETSIIGNHVKIYQRVTIGAKSTSGGQALRGVKRHPTIEDHVTIYPGVSILGGDTVIGSGSTIGGNVFLLQSVPQDSLVTTEDHSVKILPKNRTQPKTQNYPI